MLYTCAMSAGAPHTRAAAPDGLVHAMDNRIEGAGATAWEILPLLEEMGFTGIGIKMRGPWAGRFVHLDDLPRADYRHRPIVWTY